MQRIPYGSASKKCNNLISIIFFLNYQDATMHTIPDNHFEVQENRSSTLHHQATHDQLRNCFI